MPHLGRRCLACGGGGRRRPGRLKSPGIERIWGPPGTQRLPSGCAQGRRAGLNCGAPTALGEREETSNLVEITPHGTERGEPGKRELGVRQVPSAYPSTPLRAGALGSLQARLQHSGGPRACDAPTALDIVVAVDPALTHWASFCRTYGAPVLRNERWRRGIR